MVLKRALLCCVLMSLSAALAFPTEASGDPLEPHVQASTGASDTSLWGDFSNSSGNTNDNPPPTGGSDDSTDATPITEAEAEAALRQQIYDSAIANGRYVYRCVVGVNCTTPTTPSTPTPATTTAPAPTVTIRDLATFLPASTTLTMEPAHWMLRDRPTNFIAHAQQHTVTGTLLGQQADVRFTPTSYTFDYGDGTTTTTQTGGATWKELNLPEFSTTKTSHTYTQRGNHTITASANYVAAYRLNNGPWTAVTGTLTSPTTHTGRTLTINTVLVRGTCTDYPTDPGCPQWNPDQ
ncbi:hypothetical protein HQQ80_11875 [Microbacteriaceae bacterium VKM Ac-2855]|nr:hypothetical protein [Microbacteriaceae bacterium VKM Ac-2855]